MGAEFLLNDFSTFIEVIVRFILIWRITPFGQMLNTSFILGLSSAWSHHLTYPFYVLLNLVG